MKTQLTKPARGKASYTKEYKQEALELWRASDRSVVPATPNRRPRRSVNAAAVVSATTLSVPQLNKLAQ
jgi:hypothetical protein